MKKIGLTASAIAQYLGGEVDGDPSRIVGSPARIESGRPDSVCFYANPKYEHYVYESKAGVILVNRDFVPRQEVSATLVRVDNAYEAVASLLDYFNKLKNTSKRGNSLRCRFSLSRSIAPSARIGKGTYIYPQVYVGPNVRIGRGCILYPGVKIYRDCCVGDNCILQANVVIGADGFGFAPREDGSYKKIPQTGNVVIEDDVEIGANTTVDRATMASTIIHKGVKIDNLCMVAHNVEVGDHTVMAAQTGLAGSSKIGKYCIFGGQSAVVGHVSVADHTTAGGRSGISKDVRKEGEVLLGNIAFDSKEYMRAYVKFRNSGRSK